MIAARECRARQTIAHPVKLEADWCDCGRPKASRSECCERCSFLDGIRPLPRVGRPSRRADVIAALRLSSRMTLVDLAIAVYGCASPSALRVLIRVLQELTRAGRVSRNKDDVDDGGMAWRYSLVGGAQ